jgi:16S rRNA (cytosine1402-N4)-methyltransferase
MNRSSSVTAAVILNTHSPERLADIFYHYGELTTSRALARSVVAAREIKPIETAGDLIMAVKALVPRKTENKFYAKLFQALRIEVNRELENLKEMLVQSLGMLGTGGRLVVITYHSLEDRLVKNFMRSGLFAGDVEKDFYGNVVTPFRIITRKAIVPDDNETTVNPRARSAKLRVAEKL